MSPPRRLLSRLKVPAPRHIAKKKSFRSAPRIVSGRESDRCTLLIRLDSTMRFSPESCGIQLPGKSHARKFTAAIAMPTPKRTPASTRFEPPSPKAKVRPATTMATSERPRAMVLVKAVWSTLTAFSHGGVPARSLFCPQSWRTHRNLLLKECFQHSETQGALAPGAEMWWVRALSERKRESTAEVSQCRRAPLD